MGTRLGRAVRAGENPSDGYLVARHSLSYYLMRRDVLEIAMVPERLSLADIADMDLDDREHAALHGIAQDDRGVGETAGIDDGTIRVRVLLQEVDERALVIRLEVGERVPGPGDVAAPTDDLRQRRRPVDRGLARAARVEIRSVHQQELHRPSTIAAAARSARGATSVTSLNRPIVRGRIQRTFPARTFLSSVSSDHVPAGSFARVGRPADVSNAASRWRSVDCGSA